MLTFFPFEKKKKKDKSQKQMFYISAELLWFLSKVGGCGLSTQDQPTSDNNPNTPNVLER